LTEDKISSIVSNVLGISAGDVSDDTSPDSVSGWDSMAHLNLVMALETEFGISLSPEDAMEMQSVNLIKIILSEYQST
jgi:acyl carrier protein